MNKTIGLTALLLALYTTVIGAAETSAPIDKQSQLAGVEVTELARAKTCQVFSSREPGPDLLISKLTDGDTAASGWCSGAFATAPDHSLYPEFITLDLGRSAEIDRVVLYAPNKGTETGKGFPENFTIQVREEGEPYRVVLDKTGYAIPADGKPQIFKLGKVRARFVMINATRLREVLPGQFRCELSEIEVYGKLVETRPLVEPSDRVGAGAKVTHLECAGLSNPIGVDAVPLRLTWRMDSNERGQSQSAYRIVVASSENKLLKDDADIWDSGKISKDDSATLYGGKPLVSNQWYWWKVMLWSRDGRPTKWSAPAFFQTGKLTADAWKGQWIAAESFMQRAEAKKPRPKAPAVYMRKEVVTAKQVKSATAYFCGLGYGELYIDGTKIGNDLLTPGFTDFDKRVQYLAYDVTAAFRQPGHHAVGALLGNGWYSLVEDPWVHEFEKRPYVDVKKLLLNIHLQYTDGTEETVATDTSWHWSYGEITDNWMCSEDIDKRLDLGVWSRVGYDASAWKPVLVAKAPKGTLQLQREPATRQLEVVKPQRLTFDKTTNTYTYEFEREFTGWVKFRTSGPRGTAVNLKVMPARKIIQHHGRNHGYDNQLILAGTGIEEYSPRFQYNNVFLVQVSGVATEPKLEDMEGCLIAADQVKAGGFSCSDPLVNWLHGVVERSQRNYVTYLPNDPTREKKAWTQDAQNMFLSAAYMYDSRALYARWEDDIMDGQKKCGALGMMAPPELRDGFEFAMNSPWWGGVGVWLPWEWYQMYGDTTLLTKNYEGMKRYVDFCAQRGPDGIQKGWGLTDWVAVEGTAGELVNTTGAYREARIVEWTAKMMGKHEDQTNYAALAEKIKKAFNDKFFQPETGSYGPPDIKDNTHILRVSNPQREQPAVRNGTQAGQALALQLGLVPEELQPKSRDFLQKEIEAHNGFISSGFVATTYLLQELATLAPEVGFKMTTKREQPSWYAMTAGTDHEQLQEFWDGRVVCMPSLGGPLAHFNFQALGGICPDPEGPGFKKMILRPHVVGDLDWVDAWYDSPQGRIVSNWRKRDGRLLMTITVPANSTATVYVPASTDSTVTEGGQPAEKVPGIKFLRRESGAAVFAVGAGTYHFASSITGE